MKAGKYEIRIRETLDKAWADWFEDMEIRPAPEGQTILTGYISDQAALHGLLARVRDLNLTLISVMPIEMPEFRGVSAENTKESE